MEHLLQASAQEKADIQKYYNVTDAAVREDIEIIRQWLAKQSHLPQDLSDDFIEKNLLRNKFRVERTKQKLDNYYTLRGHNIDLIRDFENVVPSKHVTTFLPMPKLTPNLERIVIMQILKSDPSDYDTIEVIKINLAVEELCLQYDCALGVRYLFDFAKFSLKHLINVNPIIIAKHLTLLEKAYSQRILGFEVINFPPFANKILALMKLVLRPKIYERVKVHENMESVYESIPREYLPSDYGGSLSNISDLLNKWDKVMKDHHDFFIQNHKKISVEHLRPLESKENEIFGVDGTFKKLLPID